MSCSSAAPSAPSNVVGHLDVIYELGCFVRFGTILEPECFVLIFGPPTRKIMFYPWPIYMKGSILGLYSCTGKNNIFHNISVIYFGQYFGHLNLKPI